MINLLFVGCAIAVTAVTDLFGWAGGIPEGYEDERGFHFGPEPIRS
ncbi:MAG TPA: hypothetical protein VHD32_04320 [Candidatus Didemnitutus sp.]|nr:hypothetical protein [Candidatus Didemnitutus sp.]